MKTFSLMALLLASLVSFAQAADTTIILERKEKPLKVTNMELNVDKSNLGRAWISLDLVYNDFDDYEYKTIRTKIPGLVHDTNTKEILLDGVVCATTRRVKKRRLFRKPKWITKITTTGNCKFKTSIFRKMTTIDDGYDVITEKRYQLLINSSN